MADNRSEPSAPESLHDAFEGAQVLITGGVGFIGSNVAHRLVELGAHVTIVDSLVPEYGGNMFNVAELGDRVVVNISDVRDRYSMEHLIRGKDYLFNLAGQTSHMDSMTDPFTDLEINCTAQLAILEACRHHNPEAKIVFASTRQFYGRPEYLPVDERHPLHPADVNGINKMAGEWYHILYHEVYGLTTCALRLTNTYGPRMRVRDARQTFLGVWIRLLLEGAPFEVWEGDQLRDFTYVDDAVSALLLCGASPHVAGKVYNIGGIDEPISLLDLARLLVELAPQASFEVKAYPADRKKIDIGHYYADFTRIQNDVGWEPTVSLRDGLSHTLEFYRLHLARYVA